jgi:DNA polymerase
MTYEEYIRHPQFQVICVGVKINNDPVDVYTGDAIGVFLKSLDYSKCAVLCHNTAFDGAILSWQYGIKPKFWFDTLSMARASHNITVGGSLKALATYYDIGVKGDEVINAEGKRREDFTKEELNAYAAYCGNDVDLTYALFKKLVPKIPATELVVIDKTIRMYTEPTIELNTAALAIHLERVLEAKAITIRTVETLIQETFRGELASTDALTILRSPTKFAKLLELLGVEPPTKPSPATGRQTYAFAKTDSQFRALLQHPDDRVRILCEARLGIRSSIEETRAESLLQVSKRGSLPILLNYYGAHTGRFSGGGGLNLQNLPARGNNVIRKALCAPKYSKLIACDSSQIEARMVAWLAGQDDLVQAFREGRDVYSEFASEVYGRKITKADTVERFVGKTCILGLGYGMGAEKFQKTLEIGSGGVSVKLEQHEAERIVRLYRQKNWKIVQLWGLCGQALTAMSQGASGTITKCVDYDSQGVKLPNGIYIYYPMLRATGNGFEYINNPREYKQAVQARLNGQAAQIEYAKIYGGKVTENIVQALAALAIREQMAAIGNEYRIVLQVHDEIVLCVGAASADHAEKRLVEIMSTPPVWAPDIPLACESGQANNYGDT